jgi:hypothetical protein
MSSSEVVPGIYDRDLGQLLRPHSQQGPLGPSVASCCSSFSLTRLWDLLYHSVSALWVLWLCRPNAAWTRS